MSEMLEKVSREMREKYNADFLSGGDLVPFEESKARDAWMACAIAAVRAIEFTDEEIGAAIEATGVRFGFGVADFRIAHKHVIDSILSTPTTTGEVK